MKCLLLHQAAAGTQLRAVKCRAGRALGRKRGQLFTHIQVDLFVHSADCISWNIPNVIIAFLFTLRLQLAFLGKKKIMLATALWSAVG